MSNNEMQIFIQRHLGIVAKLKLQIMDYEFGITNSELQNPKLQIAIYE